MSAANASEARAQDVGSMDAEASGAAIRTGEVTTATVVQHASDKSAAELPEVDDFGLPVKRPRRREWEDEEEKEHDDVEAESANGEIDVDSDSDSARSSDAEDFHDATEETNSTEKAVLEQSATVASQQKDTLNAPPMAERAAKVEEAAKDVSAEEPVQQTSRPTTSDGIADRHRNGPESPTLIRRDTTPNAVSEWSHQALAPQDDTAEEEAPKEAEWQEMPAFATHRIFDDWGKVLAKGYEEDDADDHLVYSNQGGAGKGYTRVQIDEDAQSATSMDDDTAYLFTAPHASNALDEDEEGRDVVSQMQATKEFLTEGQRIAYVGVVRLSIGKMLEALVLMPQTRNTRKQIDFATEAMKMWGQKMMVRLYGHMEIDSAEQIMVEQLGEHGVLPADLTPALMQNARVRNPVQQEESKSTKSATPSVSSPRPSSPNPDDKPSSKHQSTASISSLPPPAYEQQNADQLTAQVPEDLENTKNLDIDVRWTILCDLFLLLIAGGAYDARSRTLLELVGDSMAVSWQEVCRFEKRVVDALEMQEQGDQEKWNEDEHLEQRRKMGKRNRLMVMGLCTVGGGLVIGLSAGLLAPVIGAGLAAGFTTIGVAGTSTFLGGAGAAAMIGGGGALTGGIIAVRASSRRTGSVKTFEYRPLYNNKRPNLILTISGWMSGNYDDVRLPFSTVDPIMGDVYSLHWEPEMLQSTGKTIQILATEALTTTFQQILGATILTTLMAGLSLPVMLTKLSYLIDNPWTVSLARADATGLILADSLIDRNLGSRPITLVGFSLGSRVIFSCLKELARRGALGLVQNVYLFGSPIVAKKDEYASARTVVSGRFVNGYATNDWILGYLFRATSGGLMRVSGLNSVDVHGVENQDVTALVPGHMAYRSAMPVLLQEVGWLVESLEFTEIEDPDPENHKKRQRELLREIEAARQEIEEQAKDKPKGGFKAFFSRAKRVQQGKKEAWETYDERSQRILEGDAKTTEEFAMQNQDVMFDVEAIRQEALKLALEGGEDVEEIKLHLSIKELESTLPALTIGSADLNGVGAVNGAGASAHGPEAPVLRQTKSYNDGVQSSNHHDLQSATPADNERGTEINGFHAGEASSHIEPQGAQQPYIFSSLETKQYPSHPPDPATGNNMSYTPERPRLRSVNTSPMPELRSPEDNPWGEEEEFGREKEVSLSFE